MVPSTVQCNQISTKVFFSKIYVLERALACTTRTNGVVGRAEGEGERESPTDSLLSVETVVGLYLYHPESTTWAEIKGPMLNRLSHQVPCIFFFLMEMTLCPSTVILHSYSLWYSRFPCGFGIMIVIFHFFQSIANFLFLWICAISKLSLTYLCSFSFLHDCYSLS